jgi:redox-sensitive bicupin YhaK (pirin superfamily)
VRPHPHIGLATVTYLFEGEILHRDSLGTVQPIRPGAVNWMVAGRGIVHSERTPEHLRSTGGPMFGIQTWVALPKKDEEAEPAFQHVGVDELPVIDADRARLRLIAGTWGSATSPVRVFSKLFYADAVFDAGGAVELPAGGERAVYVIGGLLDAGGQACEPGQMVVFRPEAKVVIRAEKSARAMLIGGEPLEGKRHIWWNFVSSSEQRIEQAKADWKAGRFPPVPGETEFIPLPEQTPPPQVRYP